MFKLFKKAKEKTVTFFDKIVPETIIHPKYHRLVEKSFEAEGKTFWCFKNLLDMPASRYLQLGDFHEESLFKMTHKNMRMLMEKQAEFLNKGDITKGMMINSEVRMRLGLKLEPDILYRLASCVYFYDNELLSSYDFDIGDEKIGIFKKAKLDDFFLSRPLSDLVPVKGISQEDIRIYSMALEKRKAYLKESMGIDYI